MKRLSWVRVAQLSVSVLSVSLLATVAYSQVQTLNRAPLGTTQQAGCDCDSAGINSGYIVDDLSCASGNCGSSCGGTVWGTQCISSCCGTKIGLFPPCPNPCGGTYLGDKLLNAKCGIDNGLKGLFGKILGGKRGCCDACGIMSCDGNCGMPFDGGDTGCGCSNCQSGAISMPQPTPAPGIDTSEPLPPGGPDHADPFKDDDSETMGTGTHSFDSARHHRRLNGPTNNVRQTGYQSVEKHTPNNNLRRTPKGILNNLRSTSSNSRTPNPQAIHRTEKRSSSETALPQRTARHYRHRSSAAMRPVQSGPAPEATMQFAETDDADLRFVD
jgi:hypothetical protein